MFELKRQLAHVLFGILVLWGINFNYITPQIIAIILVILFFTLLAIKNGYKVPLFYPILHFFERPKHLKRWPGRGLFFFVLGVFFTLLLFEKKIAMAAIAILLVGDAITNIAGRHLGKKKNPLNPEKTIEGTLWGILASFLTCLLFFDIIPSLFAAILAMLVEIPKIYIKNIPIDDNLTIPISAGIVLYFFSL